MISSLLRSVFSLGAGVRDGAPRCRVLFVCMGNICRSPTAEAVFRHQVETAGLANRIDCDSAGTHDFHLGHMPDARARAAALKRGYNMPRLRGRQVAEQDFERFDLILAMDRQNLSALTARCPPDRNDRLRLLMQFARRHAVLEVPDPYYGNAKGFELVLDMIEDACTELLTHVQATYLAASGKDNDAAGT